VFAELYKKMGLFSFPVSVLTYPGVKSLNTKTTSGFLVPLAQHAQYFSLLSIKCPNDVDSLAFFNQMNDLN